MTTTGVYGQRRLRELFDRRFLTGHGLHSIGSDTVDFGISETHAWIGDHPFAYDGEMKPESWGNKVDPKTVVLHPGQTLVAYATIGLDLVEGYAFFSPRSRMARVGVSATAHVQGFSQMNWAKSSGPLTRSVLVSVTSRVPVTGLTRAPLLQMRMYDSDTRVDKKEMLDMLRTGHNLLIHPRHGNPLVREIQVAAIADDGSLVTTLFLQDGVVGYRLKKTRNVLDVSGSEQDWSKWFEPVYAQRDQRGKLFVDLREGGYYLLITWEGLNLPVGYVASLQQLDSRLVAAVVHFAEYFGHAFKGAATLEVVPISAPIRIYRGTPIGSFRLEKTDLDTPQYDGFSAGQHHRPQLPPMFSSPYFQGVEDVNIVRERR